MSEKKYQVFISSTYKDLIEERRDIARSVLDLGHIPAAMEHFPAMDEEQLDYIKKIIDECDYYILVVAGKYGSIDSSGISYTEREYDYAIEMGKLVLGFPVGDMSKLPRDQTEIDPISNGKLEKFRAKLMTGRLIKTWQDRKDLELAVVKSLQAAFQRHPQTGWVRTPKHSSENFLEEINDLRKQNEKLISRIQDLSTTPIPTFEDLASHEDSFNFHIRTYSTLSINPGVGRYSTTKTWLEIILVFAQALRTPLDREELRSRTGRILARTTIFQGEEAPSYMEIFIEEFYFEIMIIQLQALGYISENTMFKYESTARAKGIYMKHTVVKKTK